MDEEEDSPEEEEQKEVEGLIEETKMDFECKSIELVVINEYQGNFLPMLMLLIERVGFNSDMTKIGESDKMKGSAGTAIRMQYFNAPVGIWEPAIEKFAIEVELLGNGKANKQIIKIADALNINVSVGLAGVLANFQKLWEIAAEKN